MIGPLLLLAAAASPSPCTAGSWVLRAGEQPVFRFVITPMAGPPRAAWERPRDFDTDGETFSAIQGPVIRRIAFRVREIDHALEIGFDDPRPGATPDIFRLRCIDADHLTASYAGTSFEPFDLIRDRAPTRPLGPWDPSRNYTRVVVRPTNAQMTAMFDADQADRRAASIDWSVVGPADLKRRARTQQLLDAGALQSGDDFYHAAFIYQHGAKPNDYLLAHLLATIATARGKTGAVWIASATLDRYLQSIGKPQVLGTQYLLGKGAAASQEPFDRNVASDALRQALHVPTLAQQEERRRAMAGDVTTAPK